MDQSVALLLVLTRKNVMLLLLLLPQPPLLESYLMEAECFHPARDERDCRSGALSMRCCTARAD